MTTSQPVERALELPSGAEFRRCALQVNPARYSKKHRGIDIDLSEKEHAEAMVAEAVSLGISILAITDHNDVRSIPHFREAASGVDVEVFPGFELTSQDGVHVLCIYSPTTTQDQLIRCLGNFGVMGSSTTDEANLSDFAFADVLDKVHEQGGIAVAAHATNDSGLFRVLTGASCIKAWRHPELLAVQIPGAVDDLPYAERQIIKNKNADYRRPHAAENDLAVATINAKDVVEPKDLNDPSATCWIKMSEVSIEGLRQAFLDPGSRVRLNEHTPDEHAELVALTWETAGFLEHAAIRFNSNLNVLVGGRGTGKSTIIESIRAVLGLEPIGAAAGRVHHGIVRDVLRNGTKISLVVRVPHPTPRQYVIEKTIPNPPIVRDEAGQVSSLSPKDIVPRIEVFGQHEISELTGSGEMLTRILRRFVDRDTTVTRRKLDLRGELQKNRSGLLDALAESNRISDRLDTLPSLEETLERFSESGLEEKLGHQSSIVKEERLLATIPERLEPLRGCLETLLQETPIDRTFISSKVTEPLPNRDVLHRLDDILRDLERRLVVVSKDLAAALDEADLQFETVKGEWNIRKAESQKAYDKTLRELQRTGIDGEEFIQLRRQIEDLKPLRDRQDVVKRTVEEYRIRRRNLLADWGDLANAEFRLLAKASKRVGKKLHDRVKIDVTVAGNREPLYELLRNRLGGRLTPVFERLEHTEAFSVVDFVEACREGPETLQSHYDLTPKQAEHLARVPEETLMQIEELNLPSTTSIQLNTAAAGKPASWQDLSTLSSGQKATAVLFLLLLDSDAPLIIDQPEDDLDNRFISEGIVPRMREEKQRRQFIFSTHNANIPVLGDAELIAGLSTEGDGKDIQVHIDPKHLGSIDSRTVRQLVEEILEGGRDAFERRRRKYGF